MKGKLLALRRSHRTSVDLSDEALISACVLGESAALGALFDRHRDTVRRFIGHLLGATARDLDDLLQLTFIEVYRSARSFAGRAAVRTWILGIANNLVRQHARSERRRNAALRTLRSVPERTTPSPEGPAQRRQQLAVLARALADLPHDLRVAFVMCDLEDVPGTEVARILAIRPGTLWRRLHDARQRLRAALEEGR